MRVSNGFSLGLRCDDSSRLDFFPSIMSRSFISNSSNVVRRIEVWPIIQRCIIGLVRASTSMKLSCNMWHATWVNRRRLIQDHLALNSIWSLSDAINLAYRVEAQLNKNSAQNQSTRHPFEGNIGDGVVNRRGLVDGVVLQGHKPPPPAPRHNPYVRPLFDKDTDGSDGQVHCNESICQ